MPEKAPASVFFALTTAEAERFARLDDDIYNIVRRGPNSAELLWLKVKRRAETKAIITSLRTVLHGLCKSYAKVVGALVRIEKSRAAWNVQWLMTQFAKHLVISGCAPTPWDADAKPPSLDYARKFFSRSDPGSADKLRLISQALGGVDAWTSLCKIDDLSYHDVKACSPRKLDGESLEIMCLDGFHDVAVLAKVAKLIKQKITFVPYAPPLTAPTADPPFKLAAPPPSLDSTVAAALSAGDEADRLEGELGALFLEEHLDAKLIREKEQQFSEATIAQKESHKKVFELCQEWTACLASIPAPAADGHLRPFKEMNFLLTRLAMHFRKKGLLPGKRGAANDCIELRFDRVLEYLHSPNTQLARKRVELHATFTDSEWQFLTDVNTLCFNALFNSAPLVVHGIPEVMCSADPYQYVANAAKLLRRGLRLVAPWSDRSHGDTSFSPVLDPALLGSLPAIVTPAADDAAAVAAADVAAAVVAAIPVVKASASVSPVSSPVPPVPANSRSSKLVRKSL